MLVGGDCLQADLSHIVDRRSQPYAARNVGRPGLKLVRQGVVVSLLEGDDADHVATTLVGWHAFQQVRLAIQDSDASGTKQLVAGEGVEIAAQLLHIYRQMWHRLRPIDYHRDVAAV